jgi:hypothetical protein
VREPDVSGDAKPLAVGSTMAKGVPHPYEALGVHPTQ